MTKERIPLTLGGQLLKDIFPVATADGAAELTKLLVHPNLGAVAEQLEKTDPAAMEAWIFGAELLNFVQQLQKMPWMLEQSLPGIKYDSQTNTITINNAVHIKFEETPHFESAKHLRFDSGQTPVPDRPYPYSIFWNSEFKDGEPVFPKHVPYAKRGQTALVRQRMGRKKLKANHHKKGGCGCGC